VRKELNWRDWQSTHDNVPERKRGMKGYDHLAALRLLVYAMLVGIDKDETLEKHLRRNQGVAKALGFKQSTPDGPR